MKSSILSLVIGSFFLIFSAVGLHAASGESIESTAAADPTSIVIENPLLLESISTPDDAHVLLRFNQPVIQESVRVRVTKQSDESNVRIESFTGGSDNQSIQIILSDILNADTAYKMTIISAISDAGVIIKDGADGLKEFITPKDLIRFAPEIILNAPSNPNAVLVTATGEADKQTQVAIIEETKTPSETTDELPLTGVDMTLFILIAGIIAFILIIRRKRA